mmetsp:Transcript_26160/g.87917  ORF Transcript_26160/g.87917 Transcript_26160/m.87917 type:complete len:222 (+) Transcript_26160:465-1130(+)
MFLSETARSNVALSEMALEDSAKRRKPVSKSFSETKPSSSPSSWKKSWSMSALLRPESSRRLWNCIGERKPSCSWSKCNQMLRKSPTCDLETCSNAWSAKDAPSLERPTILAGTPTAVAFFGMACKTTDPHPILAQSPTRMLPKMLACAPIKTPLPSLGCRLPHSFPVPPRVTPCKNEQSSPTTEVSPTTTPVAWSNMTPRPMTAFGWTSMPKSSEHLDWQ